MRKLILFSTVFIIVTSSFAHKPKRLYTNYGYYWEILNSITLMEAIVNLDEKELIDYILSDTSFRDSPEIYISTYLAPYNKDLILSHVSLYSFDSIPALYHHTEWAKEMRSFPGKIRGVENPDFEHPYYPPQKKYDINNDTIPEGYTPPGYPLPGFGDIKSFPIVERWMEEIKRIYLNQDTIYCVLFEDPIPHKGIDKYSMVYFETSFALYYLKKETDIKETDPINKKIAYLKEWLKQKKEECLNGLKKDGLVGE